MFRQLLAAFAFASTASAIVITARPYTSTSTIIEDGSTITTTMVVTRSYTTTISIATTSPYAAPSGAEIIQVEAGKDVITTYAIAPSINPIARPSALETITVGVPYTVEWKATTNENERINLMLYRSNTSNPSSVLEPIQLIGGLEEYKNGTYNSWMIWQPLINNGSVTFMPYDNIISADNYVIISNGASGINRTPFFSIKNPNPKFAHDPVPGVSNQKKTLSTSQVAGIIAGVGGFVVFIILSVFLFCLGRRNGWFVKQFKAQAATYKEELGYNEYKAKKGKGKAPAPEAITDNYSSSS